MQIDLGDFEEAFYLDFSPVWGEDKVELAVKKQHITYMTADEPRGSEQAIVTFNSDQLFALGRMFFTLARYTHDMSLAEKSLEVAGNIE